MFEINDQDLPIAVALKIISGTKPYNPTQAERALSKVFAGEKSNCDVQDMFDLEEIKEIADYLMVYYNAHPKGD